MENKAANNLKAKMITIKGNPDENKITKAHKSKREHTSFFFFFFLLLHRKYTN